MLVRDGKVDIDELEPTIRHYRFLEPRGFPIGKKRQPRLNFRIKTKEKPIIGRTLNRRLEIIAEEFDAMTDAEQMQVLRLGPGAWFGMFRLHNAAMSVRETKRQTSPGH